MWGIQRDLRAHLCHGFAVAEQFRRVCTRCRASARGGVVATGAGQGLGQLQCMFERLPHRVGRIEQYPRQAGLLGVVDGHAGADDHLDAIGAQVGDAVARVLAGDEAAMLDIRPKLCWKLLNTGTSLAWVTRPMRLAMRRARASASIRSKPLARIGTSGSSSRPRSRGIGAAGDHYVAMLTAQAFADHVHGFLEAEVDLLDARTAVELGDDVAEQAGQARNADGPDHRTARVGIGVAQRGAGQVHDGSHRSECFMIHPFQCFISFTVAGWSCL